jgi:glycosyltransferase involved in cell wall biosynthesis
VPANLPSRPSNSLKGREKDRAPAKVDVLVPTLKGLPGEFVEHLRSRIPVHCLLTSSVAGRARARQELMERVDTDWFVFIDDDVRLRPEWWAKVSGMVRPDVGAVEGLWSYLAADKRVDDYTRAMARLARLLGQESWKDRVDRAFTGDTLVRTEGVKNIRIPNLPVWEDEYIRGWVEKNGYRWLRTSDVVCDHLRRYNLKESYDAGKYGYYLGRLSLRSQLKRVAELPVKILFALAYTRNTDTGTFAVEKDLKTLKGVLHAYVRRGAGSPIYSFDQP